MGVDPIALDAKRRAVFLDRDGVINRAILRSGRPYPPRTMAELVIPDEVYPALTMLVSAGFLLIVVTNQPDVARGAQSRAVVEDLHAYLQSRLPLEMILTCFHDDPDNCACRKPKPGLLLEAARLKNIDLAESYMIGDRWRDIEAGQRAGCRTVFIDYGYEERKPASPAFQVRSITEAVDAILSMESESAGL